MQNNYPVLKQRTQMAFCYSISGGARGVRGGAVAPGGHLKTALIYPTTNYNL